MKTLKPLFILILALQSISLLAQDYPFISKDLRLMSEEEMMKNNVQLNPNDIVMYDKDGNKIDASQINDIMTSGNFMPVIFANDKNEPKALVFRATTKEEKVKMQQMMSRQNPNADFKTGVLAKDFTSTDLEGKKVNLNDLKGKIVVLNFWFTKCHPCVEEMPELNKIVSKYKNKNVEFIAITFDDREKLNQFFKKHKFDYRIVSDSKIIKDYKVNSFPLNMIIDQKGEIAFKKIGAYLDELDTKIGLLLKE